MSRHFVRLVAVMYGFLAAVDPVFARTNSDSTRPNIVFILADDLGGMDVGCYGADLHETPRIDALARQGVRFTQAYASAPVCTPTRAALLTGKNPARLHMTTWAEQARIPTANMKWIPAASLPDLPHSETTLATHLHKAGYLTALVGKWHLGDADHAPQTHGFDINIGGTHWGAPQTYFFPFNGGGRFGKQFRYVPNLEFGKPGEYLTDRLTDEAIRVIDHAGDRPFFLYLAHHAVHTPLEAKPADVAHFQGKIRPGMKHRNPTYASMLKSLDESVGRVLDEIERRGLSQRTIVIFTSDNGGFIGVNKVTKLAATNNAPLRSGKGSLYEGGLRVPLVVRWPNLTSADKSCAVPVVLTDWFPTLLAAAGLNMDATTACDGIDLRPVLKDTTSKFPRDELHFHFPHYYETTTPASCLRKGDWKLIHYYEGDRDELYDLANDPYEKRDAAGDQKLRTKAMRQSLDRWLVEVKAAMPKPR